MGSSAREVLREAAAVPDGLPDLDRLGQRAGRRRTVRRAVSGIAGLVVLIAVAVLVVDGRFDDDVPVPAATGPTTTASAAIVGPGPTGPPPGPGPTVGPSPFPNLPVGWTELPAPPEVRHFGATQWTGTGLLMWGGTRPGDTQAPVPDGFVFDARTRTWTAMPGAPMVARWHPASAWTGRELLVWGGLSGGSVRSGELDDGAAYDPARGTWRTLPVAPIDARAPLSVWTGEEFVVWGTAVRGGYNPPGGAAYRPATDSWRRIAKAPVELSDAVAVWTGREMIVFGALLSPSDNAPATPTAIGAAYNPRTDSWRRLPDSTLSPQATTAAWTGRELVAWDYLMGAAGYDPARDRWRALPKVPLAEGECVPRSVPVGGRFFGNFCGLLAIFDGGASRWQAVPRDGLTGWHLELVRADPVVLLLGRELAGTAELLLAYRPAP